MPLFYFNFRDENELLPDANGIEFASIEEAYLEAFQGAQQMWAEMLQKRKDPMRCAFEIADAGGSVLMVLPFSEVLETCTGNGPSKPKRRHKSVRTNVDRSKQLRIDVSNELGLLQNTLCATKKLLARCAAN